MDIVIESKLKQAQAEAIAGNKDSAKRILAEVVQKFPKDPRGWYALSQFADSPEQAIYCLNKVLELKPNNEQALERLKKLQSSVTNQTFLTEENSDGTKESEISESDKRDGKYEKSSVTKLNSSEKKLLGIGIAVISVVSIVVIVVIIISRNIRIDAEKKSFVAKYDRFIVEADKLSIMTEQGVNYSDFKSQLLEVKTAFRQLDNPSTYLDSQTTKNFNDAFVGWDLIVRVWEIKIDNNYIDTIPSNLSGVIRDVKNYTKIDEDMIPFITFSDLIPELMGISFSYYLDGKQKSQSYLK